jgi:uncharacterized protein (TIGR02145 family)
MRKGTVKRAKNIKIPKSVLFGVPVLLAAALGGLAYAAIDILAPTAITYSTPTATTMQGFTPALCANMDTYTTQVLTDTRNAQNYRVRKMPDGRCWMLDNLKLADYTLTSADSNVSANFTIPSSPVQSAATHSNGTGHTANGSGYLTTDGASYGASNYAFIAFTDPSLSDNSYYDNCTGNNGISADTLTGCGYLYNWYTATAGTGTYSTASGSVTESICPTEWTLPTGGSSGQFAILNNAMATGATTASTTSNATTIPNWYYNGPFEGSLAGNFNAGFGSTGYNGYYWSSTASSSTSAYGLVFGYSNVGPGNSDSNKSNGFAVRCIL